MERIANSPLVVLIDSDCLVCNRSVLFLARRDRDGLSFRFGALASEAGARALAAHGLARDYADSVVVLDGGRVLTQSAALIAIAARMSLFWRMLARVASVVPVRLRDRWYGALARHRYYFGRTQSESRECALPHGNRAGRFL